ncbi:hypothetical protein ACTA71_006461 [Dictyostelium dimigraforme]
MKEIFSYLNSYFIDNRTNANNSFKFLINFFSSHILMEKVNYDHKQIVLDTLNKEIIHHNRFTQYLSNVKQYSFSQFNSNVKQYGFSEFHHVVIPENLDQSFPYFPITSIYNRIVEIDKIMEKLLLKRFDYSPTKTFLIKVIGDENIGISSFCNIFNSLSIYKKHGILLIDSEESPLQIDAYILAYNIGNTASYNSIKKHFKSFSKPIYKKPFLIVGLESDLIEPYRKLSFNDGKLLADKYEIELFLEICLNENYDYERLLKYFIYEREYPLHYITLSIILQELNYSTFLKPPTQSFNNGGSITNKKVHPNHLILELMFCVDLPIIQFIHEIKSLGYCEKLILNLLKKDIIEINCIVYKLQSIKLNKNHQHHLSLNENKQIRYRNFQKLLIYSKIENYKEIIKALSPIYSHDMETTNFIKSYFNDKTMYSKKDIDNLIQDISWCDDIMVRVNLIGNLEIIKYYQERMGFSVNYSNNCTIVNFKNKSVN